MALRHVIVHVDGSDRASARVTLAAGLCRDPRSRLTGLFAEDVTLGSSIVGRRSPEAIRASMQAAQAAFLATAAAVGARPIWWALGSGRDVGSLAGDVAICCRYGDLAVFGQPQDEGRLPEDVLEAAVLGAGRPVLVIPEVGRHDAVGSRAVVAWTGSRESARAVNDALPLLAGAELVVVLAFQERGAAAATAFPNLDVVAHLEAHGIVARYERVLVDQDDDIGVVDTTLNRCADATADLVVMGARAGHGFGTPRLARHARGMLRSMTTPVLFSA